MAGKSDLNQFWFLSSYVVDKMTPASTDGIKPWPPHPEFPEEQPAKGADPLNKGLKKEKRKKHNSHPKGL